MTFDQRLAAIGPRLIRQLDRLYGNEHDTRSIFDRLVALMRVRHSGRPAELLDLDAARLANPNWFVDPGFFGYSSYVEQFGGSITGVAAHVDHLAGLDVRYLHLLALLRARTGDSDGGFAVADYLSVEPGLGTMADVEDLAARLRQHRISLCVDLALNHTADQHAWANAACAGDPFYRDFYIVVSEEESRAYEANLAQVFPKTAPGNFTNVADMGGWVWTTFYPFQWDLNWRNPEVLIAMFDIALTLANAGFEAFRLDSTAYLWKEMGTNCRNLPQAHYIVRALRAVLDVAAPATLLKAEAIVPTAYVPPYFGADDGDGFEPECHLIYNNSLMVAGWVALAEQSAALPSAILKASDGLPSGANWLTYVRCHDDIGWGAVMADLEGLDPDPIGRLSCAARFLEGQGESWARGESFQSDGPALHGINGSLASLAGLEAAATANDRELVYRRIALVNALAIAAGGLATTYMGDEIGLLNDHSYLNDPDKAHEGRWIQRPRMDWTALETPRAQCITSDLVSLHDARQASGGRGASTLLESGHPAVLGIRCGTDQVYLNFSDQSVGIALGQDGSWRDRFDGADVAGPTLALSPWQTCWLGPIA